MSDDSAPTPAAPPGWYPDPKMVGTQRYWDGVSWSDHVAPATSRASRGGEWVPVSAKKRETGGLYVAGVVTGLLLPIVGFIIGIVLLTKDDKRGVWVMVGSIGAGIFWFNQLQPDPVVTNYYGY